MRKKRGLTQQKLAKELGLTFQQVQKYEKGTNRISASKLYDMARILDVEIGYFFDSYSDVPGDEEGAMHEEGMPSSPAGLSSSSRLVEAYERVHNQRVRNRILDLVESLEELS